MDKDLKKIAEALRALGFTVEFVDDMPVMAIESASPFAWRALRQALR